MAARCFTDTCTITTSESSGAILIDVNFDQMRGLACDATEGLWVNLRNETAITPTADEVCNDILRYDNAGQLIAPMPNILRATMLDGNLRAVPNDGSSSPTSLGGFSVENQFDCEATMLVVGQFELNYEIEDVTTPANNIQNQAATANYVPFNANFEQTLLIDGSPVLKEYADVGGIIVDQAGPQYKKRWSTFTYVTAINAGDTVNFSDQCRHDGSTQRLNVTLNTATTIPDFSRGFRTTLEVYIIPHSVTNI